MSDSSPTVPQSSASAEASPLDSAKAAAQADLAHIERKIRQVQLEIKRVKKIKREVVKQRDKVAAFVELYPKYAGEQNG